LIPLRWTREYYARATLQVARELLGQRLVRIWEGQRLAGRIVEVEAYLGIEDQASHARSGSQGRAGVMFGAPGHAYVYLIYGMHYCLNLVTESDGQAAAVLIRALEPLEGLEQMARLRGGAAVRDLARGPGRLCAALGIDRSYNGQDLCVPEASLWVEAEPAWPEMDVAQGPRIGVRGDSSALTAPWRFYLRYSRWVSGPAVKERDGEVSGA